MVSRQLEQLARQRNAELGAAALKAASIRAAAARPKPASSPRPGGIRTHTGWAIVAIGLRIAESGNHRASVATAGHTR